MYLDGYKPEEILYASRKAMYKKLRKTTTDDGFDFHITSEVKQKRELIVVIRTIKRRRKRSNPRLKQRFSGLWKRA